MTLSVRLEPDLELAFEREVKRRSVTKSQFINQLLREALQPKDPVALLMAIREKHGLPDPAQQSERTDKAAQVQALVQAALRQKHGRSSK